MEYLIYMMKFFVSLALVLMTSGLQAVNVEDMQTVQQTQQVTDDFKILSDEVKDGIRYVVAVPSASVCSKKIEIELKGKVIQKVVYTRGCDGNAKGIGALIKGMKIDEAVRRLEGITCGRKQTSCPDQLAKILKQL